LLSIKPLIGNIFNISLSQLSNNCWNVFALRVILEKMNEKRGEDDAISEVSSSELARVGNRLHRCDVFDFTPPGIVRLVVVLVYLYARRFVRHEPAKA
jgi:hypothetical protein